MLWLHEAWPLLKGLKMERSAICVRKDVQLASTIIAPRKKGSQQGLMEQRKVTSQGKGRLINPKVKPEKHHARQHPIESSRISKTLVRARSFLCRCQPQVSQIVKFLSMPSLIHRVTRPLFLKKRQRFSTQSTNQFS